MSVIPFLMAIGFMSPVDFKEGTDHLIESKGQGPLVSDDHWSIQFHAEGGLAGLGLPSTGPATVQLAPG